MMVSHGAKTHYLVRIFSCTGETALSANKFDPTAPKASLVPADDRDLPSVERTPEDVHARDGTFRMKALPLHARDPCRDDPRP